MVRPKIKRGVEGTTEVTICGTNPGRFRNLFDLNTLKWEIPNLSADFDTEIFFPERLLQALPFTPSTVESTAAEDNKP